MSSRVDLLLALADDELILGWRNSEWTGIAPFLEEDVAFSSIAQNEIGHARALYELAARELGTDADALAFDRPLEELWPYALGVLDEELRPELVRRVGEKLDRAMPAVEPVSRGRHEAELAALLEEMTMVRRSAPAGARW